MSSFTKRGQRLKEGDKVLWDGINAMVIAAAEEDTECPYRVFSEKHEVSGWVAGEVLELVEMVSYEEAAVGKEMLKIGDFVRTSQGLGVVLTVDPGDDEYFVGTFGVGSDDWFRSPGVTFLSRPDYGMEV